MRAISFESVEDAVVPMGASNDLTRSKEDMVFDRKGFPDDAIRLRIVCIVWNQNDEESEGTVSLYALVGGREND